MTRDKTEGKRNAVKCHAALHATLTAVLVKAQDPSAPPVDLQTGLTTALSQSEEVGRALRAFMAPGHYNHLITPRSHALVARMFAVSELLEHVLLHLDPATLLQVQAVCRAWKYAIRESASLNGTIGWAPASLSGNHTLAFKNGRHRSLYIRNAYQAGRSEFRPRLTMPVNILPISARFRQLSNDAPRKIYKHGRPPITLGSGFRKILICQSPVIKCMSISASCSAGALRDPVDDITSLLDDPSSTTTFHGDPGKAPYLMDNAAGLTIGDLYDAWNACKAAHDRHCRSETHRYDHDSGELLFEVDFEACIELAENDAMLIGKLQKQQETEREAALVRAYHDYINESRQQDLEVVFTYRQFRENYMTSSSSESIGPGSHVH